MVKVVKETTESTIVKRLEDVEILKSKGLNSG